jgi:hypothetical protein
MGAPDGLTFAEIIIALRERQQHEVHRGTIHALLSSGGFVQREHRWFAAPDNEAGARQLRAAFIETLVPREQNDAAQSLAHTEYIRVRVKAVHLRLSEIISTLQKGQVDA